MRRIAQALWLVCLLGLVAAKPVAAQDDRRPAIVEPRPGEILQGTVTIAGSSDVPGFLSAEIAFTYVTSTNETWFLIASSDQPAENGTLATWDTTIIADGDCNLRLRVALTDGNYLEAIVPSLRVRNYMPVGTSALASADRLTGTPYPTPTPLPPNPAELTPINVWKSIGYGGVAVVLLFAVLGVYLWLRRK